MFLWVVGDPHSSDLQQWIWQNQLLNWFAWISLQKSMSLLPLKSELPSQKDCISLLWVIVIITSLSIQYSNWSQAFAKMDVLDYTKGWVFVSYFKLKVQMIEKALKLFSSMSELKKKTYRREYMIWLSGHCSMLSKFKFSTQVSWQRFGMLLTPDTHFPVLAAHAVIHTRWY